jgi:hypothetical protein
MAKPQPPDTKSKTIYIPLDLHTKITRIAGYGKVDPLIIECLEEAIEPRYEKWVKEELAKVTRRKQRPKGVQ